MEDLDLSLKIKVQDQASTSVQAVANKTKRVNEEIKNSTKQSENEQQQAKKKTAQVSQELATKAEMHAKRVAQAKKTLEIKTERDLQFELRKTQQAYQTLAKSGVASARDLAKAREAVIRKERELRAEMGKQPLGQRVMQAGQVTAGIIAGGMAAKQVLAPAMNDRKQWDANVTNVALQAFGDKSVGYIQTQGIRQIEEAVKNTVKNVGGTHDQALGALNAMMVNGLDFDTANAMLPQAQRMQIAGEADSDSIGSLLKVLSDYGFKGEQLTEAFNHALRSGMDGKFEIADMVRELPSLLSKAQQAGFTGIKDFDYLLGWLQSAANKAGTNSEAANNVGNTLEKMNAEDTKKRLDKLKNPTQKGKNVDWDKSKLTGREKGYNPVEMMNKLARQMLDKDKEYQKLKARLKTAKTDEEKGNIQSQLNLKQGMVFSQLLPDVQAKAGLTASADKEAIDGYMANTQNQALTNGLDYKRFAITMGTDKAIDEQRASLEFLNEELSSNLNRAERAWNDFWLNLGRDNPEMLGMYADLKLALGAVAAAAGVAAVSLAAIGGKDLLSSVLDKLGKGAGGVDIGDLGSKSKGSPKVGGGKFGKALTWGSRVAGVVGVATMLNGDESEETKKVKSDYSSAVYAKSKGMATPEQEKTLYEQNKRSVEKYDNGGWFTRLTMSESGIKKARQEIAIYEGKQAVNSTPSFTTASSAMGVAQMASQIGALATQQSAMQGWIGATSAILSQYQADFNAFGQTISDGIQAGLAAQSHTIDNRITVELDGVVIAENVSQRQFQFFKRG